MRFYTAEVIMRIPYDPARRRPKYAAMDPYRIIRFNK